MPRGRAANPHNYTLEQMYEWADYLVENDTTLSGLEEKFGICRKSIWHFWKRYLEWNDPERYEAVRKVLEKNRRRTGYKSPNPTIKNGPRFPNKAAKKNANGI